MGDTLGETKDARPNLLELYYRDVEFVAKQSVSTGYSALVKGLTKETQKVYLLDTPILTPTCSVLGVRSGRDKVCTIHKQQRIDFAQLFYPSLTRTLQTAAAREP